MNDADPQNDTPQHDDSAESATDAATAADSHAGRELSPALIATLVTIPVMVIAGFIAFAVVKNKTSPSTPVDSYATVAQDAKACDEFVKALPQKLGDFGDKQTDGTTVRWTGGDNGPIVVRCGVQRPEALAPTSGLQVINPIQWFMTDSDESRGQAYVAVDHRPYVAVWVPVGAGNTSMTEVSALVAEKLTPAPLDFGK